MSMDDLDRYGIDAFIPNGRYKPGIRYPISAQIATILPKDSQVTEIKKP